MAFVTESAQVDAAFLVVVGKRPDALGEPLRRVVESSDSPHLGFQPDGHVSWHDRSGRVLFGAWQLQTVGQSATAWLIDDQQVVTTAGFVWWREGLGCRSARAQKSSGARSVDLRFVMSRRGFVVSSASSG